MSALVPLLLPLLAVGAAPAVARDPVAAFCAEPRVVWCEAAEELPFRRLAAAAAPLLWFSPDEPLLRGNRRRRIPQRIDCGRVAVDPAEDPSPDGPAAVYYQVSRALARGEPQPAARAAFEAQRIPLAATRKLTLRYFFYYEEDFGFGAHVHDLEGMEYQVAIEQGPTGWRRARLLSAKAYAHGSDWQSNILQMPADVVLPLSVFVEEGKHASCPDRNGDGVYTPGYDVTERVHDAWGVRDIFGSRLTGARFRSEGFKARSRSDEGFKVGPAAESLSESAVEQRARYVEKGFELPRGTYELVSAHETEPCPQSGLPGPANGRGFFNLGKRMSEEGFGVAGPVVHENGTPYRYGPGWPFVPFRNMSPRWSHDGRSLYQLELYSWKELALVGGWPFVRVGATFETPERWVVDLGYTPSQSRVIDWYAAAGARWDRLDSGRWDASFEAEAGLQLRYRVLGLRLGLRSRVSGSALADERFVIQLGLGPFPGGSVRGQE